MSNCLWLQELKHVRLLCPSLSTWVFSNSCQLSQWCHPTISSSVSPSPLALKLSEHQGLFQRLLFTSGEKSIGASALVSVFPMNIQGSFPLGMTDLIFLSKLLSRVFFRTTVQKHQFFGSQPSLWSNSNIHIWLLEKLWP